MAYLILYQSFIAGLATLLGALLILAFGKPSEHLLSVLLGFAGGVMTAVVVFDLLPSALAYGSWFSVSLGFLSGILLMFVLDLLFSTLPIVNNAWGHNRQGHFLKMGYLIATGIALHDLPEGIAIAVGYSAQESLGFLIALAIGLHNVPEGMATAAPLTMGGLSRRSIVLLTLLISIFTPLGAALGLIIIHFSPHLVCLLLALAGGAMAFIIRNELLPEAHRKHPNYARLGLTLGFLLILILSFFHG